MDATATSDTLDYFFFARQPIFDNTGKVWGYELLFRSGPGRHQAEISDEDLATICVATCGFVKAQEDTDLNKKICINFTENLILQGGPRGLPPTVTVIELLENIKPGPQVLDAIIKLKQDGYLFAIDDYVGNPNLLPFVELADIVKVDILGMSLEEIDKVYATIKDFKGLKIAEKVDNQEVLTHLKALGFDLYQGYYFAKPENLSDRKLKSTNLSKLRIINQIEDPAISTGKIVDIINADPSITYRLLRLLNTAAFGFSIKITSVRHAVTLLGNKRLKHWLRMVVLSDLILSEKTPELYVMALARGRFLEELVSGGHLTKANAETLFLFGMLSLIEVMLDAPMQSIMDDLPLPKEIKGGYLDQTSLYAKYLLLVSHLEQSRIEAVAQICRELNLPENKVAEAFLHAIAWATQMSNQLM